MTTFETFNNFNLFIPKIIETNLISFAVYKKFAVPILIPKLDTEIEWLEFKLKLMETILVRLHHGISLKQQIEYYTNTLDALVLQIEEQHTLSEYEQNLYAMLLACLLKLNPTLEDNDNGFLIGTLEQVKPWI